jgi:hypothetical protein
VYTVDSQIVRFVSYLFKDILPLENIVKKNMKNLEISLTKVRTRIKKMFLQEGYLKIFLLLVETEEDLVDSLEMAREYVHHEVENVILIIRSFLSLNVKNVFTNNLVVINHFASFIILKVNLRMNGRQMRKK